MSIYPVRLNEWYPIGDPHYLGDISDCFRCISCRKKVKYKKMWSHHSLPFGYGDIWCSEKCLNSGKTARPDKRRERSLRRRWYKTSKIYYPLQSIK